VTVREAHGVAEPLRVGNASGFYGDRFAAVREMLEGGPLDVLTGDYLAELTMLILGRTKMKHPDGGYATTFLRQMEESLATAVSSGVRIVTNAGGLNPMGLAAALEEVAARVGVDVGIAAVVGDDLLARADELELGAPLTANAYLGAWGIAEALSAGAQVVVTGRVTDAALVVGPAAAHFGWGREDWDRLAGATVAGHVLECGAQATGGNYSFFTEIDVRYPGFPLAEVHADGSSVITKHPGTGGAVTVETVTAQLLYEIAGARYAGPDVTTRLDSIELADDGPDRVRISGVRGEPPPPTTKVCLNHLGGFRNSMTFVLTGLDIEAKAALAEEQIRTALPKQPAELVVSLVRTDHPDAAVQEEASALLRVVVKDADEAVVGRAFSGAAIEMALASYPGFHATSAPGGGGPYGVYTAAYVDNDEVVHEVVLPGGERRVIPPPAATQPLVDVDVPSAPPPSAVPPSSGPEGPTTDAPLGQVVGARSGDKGGNANVGVWARTDEAWPWLAGFLTVDRLRELLPEAAGLVVARHELPNLRAVNFVIEGLLGDGVAASTRYDPQAKAVGEWLRSRVVPVPSRLL
jgi:hypothetical protein